MNDRRLRSALTRGAWVCLLFAALTALMTWPQALVFQTRSYEHFDVFFNLWRLRWIEHALATSPSDLFNGNQFYPDRGVLAYSDAILLQGFLAAPLLAAGLKPLLVHNLLLYGGMAASGAAMFVLARYLTRSDAAAVVAGVIFAFAPYRFGHMMHMEMQWGMWIPLAFWSMQRTLDEGRLKWGLLTGVFVVLQLLSCVYYTIFLGLMLALAGGGQLIASPRRASALRALVAGALLAAVLGAPYAIPYRRASSQVGLRSEREVSIWSGTLKAYASVSESNALYSRLPKGSDEIALFPGIAPLLLTAAALVLVRPAATIRPYLLALIVAFDLSLGTNGLLYPVLYRPVPIFRGLRAPARASIFVLLALAALASSGLARLLDRLRPAWRLPAAAATVVLLLAEYWVSPMRLIDYANDAPPVYRFLAAQPAGVVAHFPMVPHFRVAGFGPRYVYGSTFHWKPIVNGYSGYFPPSHAALLDALEGFPGTRALSALRAVNVRYIVVHEGNYRDPSESSRVIEGLVKEGAVPLTRLHDGYSAASVFEIGDSPRF